jgi:integrase
MVRRGPVHKNIDDSYLENDGGRAGRASNRRCWVRADTAAPRAEGFGEVETSHYVFAAFVPKFKFSGKRVIDYHVTGFDQTRHLNGWRSAWRTLTKKAGLPGFRFHDLRHCAITQLAENGASDSTIMAIAGHVSRRMLERHSHVRMEAKRNAVEALAASTKAAGYDTSCDTNHASNDDSSRLTC